MRYELRLTAFDVMDEVWITVTVDGTGDDPQRTIERVLVRSVRAQGTGKGEAIAWTREALAEMLRAL